MTSQARSFTNPAYTRIRPFYQVADSKCGGNAGLFGLKHDICTAFPTTPAGTPHPRPPGMGKADRPWATVPLSSPHFTPTENPFRHRNAPNVPLPLVHFAPARKPFRTGNVA